MIKYIGDISMMDAQVLCQMAQEHHTILEFGCGASTQVIAKYKANSSSFRSIDTSQEWIDKTIQNLGLLGISSFSVEFEQYEDFMGKLKPENQYDFIFDDGADSLRKDFALKIWPHLATHGHLALHDTRRPHDFRNVLEILATFQNEIGAVYFNTNGSNITTIQKVQPKPYDNWQIRESKEPWMLGYGEIPAYYKKLMKESI